MKSSEFMPRNEEQKEEDNRLYKNDPGMDYNTGSGFKKYVPIEDVANPVEEENEENEIDEDDEDDDDDLDEEEKIHNEISKVFDKKKIGFATGSDSNAAHVGPEFYEEEKTANEEIVKEAAQEQAVGISQPIVSSIKEKIGAFMHGWKSRKEYSDTKGVGKDNLKTMPDSKKERQSREKVREVLHNADKIDY